MKNKKGNVAMIAIIIVFVAIIAGVIGWIFAKKTQAPQVAENQSITPVTQTQPVTQPVALILQQSPTQPSSASYLTYKEGDYGFTLALPSRWQGYHVEQNGQQLIANGNISLPKIFTFSLPIKPSANDSGSTNYTGTVFILSVFTKDEWKNVNPHEGYTLIKEGKVNRGGTDYDFIFAYSMGQDDSGFPGFPEINPDGSYKGPFYDVQNVIIPSFKLGTVN